MFEIHPQLQKDCIVVGKFNLCHLLLMNDSNYPWFILVPEKENIKEIFQLSGDEQSQLLKEITSFSKLLNDAFKADKMNIAALGNMVPQLHIHVIVRYKNDAAWPGPVWGKVPVKEYTKSEKETLLEKLKKLLNQDFICYKN